MVFSFQLIRFTDISLLKVFTSGLLAYLKAAKQIIIEHVHACGGAGDCSCAGRPTGCGNDQPGDRDERDDPNGMP